MSETAHRTRPVTTSENDRKDFQPGQALYREVLAAFMRRTVKPNSLQEWLREQEPPIARSTANAALLGAYDSEEARTVRQRILIAAGLLSESAKD